MTENILNKNEDGDVVEYENEIDKTFEILNSGETHMKLCEQKQVVLMIGTTGTGKSTLTQYISGEELYSKEVGDNSGQYTISDGDNKISTTNTIISKTIYPELFVDNKTNVAYYDTPGFSDTRSTAYDIAATYFIKQILDHIESIKLCFCVTYHSCRTGTDRSSFMTFLTHIASFAKNIEKFRNAISLIVTKVDNSYVKKGKIYELAPDEKIIENIAEFLHEVIGALNLRLKEPDLPENDKIIFENSIKLVNILLEKRDGDYLRIAIFGRPDEPGPLDKIEMLFEDKERIQNILFELTEYVQFNPDDFGYTISEKSKYDILLMIEQINGKIVDSVIIIQEQMKNFFQETAKVSIDNIGNLKKYFKNVKDKLNLMIDNINNETNINTFIKSLDETTMELKILIDKKEMDNIKLFEKYFKFFKDLNGTEVKGRPIEWITPIKDLVVYVNSIINWFSFLADLTKHLSSYEIQKDNSNFRKPPIIDQDDYLKFLEKLNKSDINVDNMIGIGIEEYQLDQLNSLMKLLYSKMNFELDGFTITFTGLIICIKNCLPIIDKHRQKINSIEILATHSLYVDDNILLEKGKIDLTIIAPIWHTLGKCKILLTGLDGSDYDSVASLGTVGQPGRPGQPSGNFIAIGSEFKGCEKLSVHLIGGKGGNGQTGGQGHQGRNGQSVWPRLKGEFGSHFKTLENACNRFGFYCHRYNHWKDWNTDHFDYVVYERGDPGGQGFFGGVKGQGGWHGKLKILQLNEDSKIIPETKRGLDGSIGAGGIGGIGGWDGSHMKFHIINNQDWEKFQPWDKPNVLENLNQANVGINGGYNPNTSGYIMVDIPGLDNHEIIKSINKFKYYSWEFIKFEKFHENKFLNKLDNSCEITSFYDINGYMKEVFNLEIQYNFLKGVSTNLEPIYESLLSRMSDRSLTARFGKNSDSIKILNYLYLVVKTKIINIIKDSINPKLNIDITSHLKNIIEIIDSLKSNQKLINVQNNYKINIENNITNATGWIVQELKPALDLIDKEIEEKIQTLIAETITIEKSTEHEKRQLISKKNDLKNTLIFSSVLSGLKMIEAFVDILGTIGMAVIHRIGTGSMVADSLLMNESGQSDSVKIPDDFINSIEISAMNFTIHLLKKKTNLIAMFDSIIQDIENCPKLNDLSELKTQIVDWKDQVNSSTNLLSDSESIGNIDRQLKSELKIKLVQSRQGNCSSQKRHALDTFENKCKIADLTGEVFSNIKQNQNQLPVTQLFTIIEQAEVKVKKVKIFKEEINDIITPVLKQIFQTIGNSAGDFVDKSQVGLTISNWNIQVTLKRIKLQLHTFTNEIKVNEQLSHIIEKLDRIMNTFAIIYDNIKECYEQEQIADYIENINSPLSLSLGIKDSLLMEFMTVLEKKIKSNILLGQFAKAKNVLAQWVFPFGKLYLEQFILPEKVELNENFDQLLSYVINQIELIVEKVNEYKELIMREQDTHLTIAEFNSNSILSRPFFIWKGFHFKNAISRLLSGEPIELLADVRDSNTKNAVKFTLINLNIVSLDSTKEAELIKQLNNYKIEITHSGYSYYKINNKYYVINSESQTLVYTYEKGDSGLPISTNEVYNKILNGDIMLSPYTHWRFRLIDENGVGFTNLKDFEDSVNLELVGQGSFIDSNFNDYNNLDLDKYYIMDETIC